MKYIIILIIGISTFITNAQNDNETITFTRIGELTKEQINNSGASKLNFITEIQKAKEMAEMDIKNEIPFLLLAGGIAPTIIATDPIFEKEYKIYFYEFGCTSPEKDLIIAYNEVIFEHLIKDYGNKWKKEIRNDVIGFKDWRKK
ncbi:FEKKY domain-containing protein [Psychroserpens ponticola]|uniref:Uncharacterized protein n=1 Tax=Psychroserpens ponticola TaxID=2932268 RepID=A0ABY7S2B4_9FLAO|nr:hypothetical protein [Psychroserpens ponticola]WCO03539.1 hypothetical protein MUN68_008525 [Psychroserpens ponticola]